MKRTPLLVVTGGIASGKSTIAAIIAEKGSLVDADRLAHGALEDPEFKKKLAAEFGAGVFTPSGKVSRRKLGRVVFGDKKKLGRFDRIIRPFVKNIISEEIKGRRGNRYIVLDAVLFFQYKFRLKADLVVAATAPEQVRLRRLMRRDGMSRKSAMERIERQRGYEKDWNRADMVIDTSTGRSAVRKTAERIRERFILERCS